MLDMSCEYVVHCQKCYKYERKYVNARIYSTYEYMAFGLMEKKSG